MAFQTGSSGQYLKIEVATCYNIDFYVFSCLHVSGNLLKYFKINSSFSPLNLCNKHCDITPWAICDRTLSYGPAHTHPTSWWSMNKPKELLLPAATKHVQNHISHVYQLDVLLTPWKQCVCNTVPPLLHCDVTSYVVSYAHKRSQACSDHVTTKESRMWNVKTRVYDSKHVITLQCLYFPRLVTFRL